MIDTNELRKAASAVFAAMEESVAQDLSDKLNEAARVIDELRGRKESTDRKKNMTDAMVGQGLLNAIELTLDPYPTKEDLDETYVAVLAYKEFQQALTVKLERDVY